MLLPVLLLILVQLGLVVSLMVLTDPALLPALQAAETVLLGNHHRILLVMLLGILNIRMTALVAQLNIHVISPIVVIDGIK